MDSKDVLQMLQQKIGNVELTLHALIRALETEDLLGEDRVTEEAQEIVKEMQTEIGKEKLDISTD